MVSTFRRSTFLCKLFSFDFALCILVLDDSTLMDRIVWFVHSLLFHCQCGTTVKNYVYLGVLLIDFPGNISCFSFCYHRITKNFKTTISWYHSFGSLQVISFRSKGKNQKCLLSLDSFFGELIYTCKMIQPALFLQVQATCTFFQVQT